MWPFRTPAPTGQPAGGRLDLAPVTPASFLAGRAALGCAGPDTDADLEALPDAALVAFVDAVTEGAEPVTYADRAALVAVASRVFAVWTEAVERHNTRARAQAEAVFTAMNWWPESSDAAPPMPEEMTASPEWHHLRGLPLWEVVMGGQIAAARAARDKVMEPVRVRLGEHQHN